MSILGFDGCFVRLNAAWEDVLGYAPAELEGRAFMDFVHPEDQERTAAAAARLIEGAGNVAGFENRYRARDGGYRWLRSTITSDGEHELLYAVARDVTPEKDARLDTERLAAFVRFSQDAILTKDRDGIITSWNEGARRMYGYDADEAIGSSVRMLVPAEIEGEDQRILTQILAGKSVEHYETSRVDRLGRRLEVSVSASAVHDEQGGVSGVTVIARDITASQRAEARLLESEQRYREIVETALEGIVALDASGAVVMANPGMTSMLGYSEDEMTGKPLTAFTDEQDPVLGSILTDQGLTSSKPREVAFRRCDGAIVWTLVSSHRRCDRDGGPLGALLMVANITVRWEAESAARGQALRADRLERDKEMVEEDLRASQARFVTVVESMDDVVFTLDLEGRHTGVYGRWLQREGFTPDLFLGRTGREIFGPGAEDHEPWVQAAKRGDSVKGFWAVSAGGATRYFDVTVSPLRGRDDVAVGVLGVVREITAYRRATDALIEAQEEIINRLLRAAEFRDDDTGAHIARMSEFCERIGHRLGLGSEDCHSLGMAAAMHDIGKIAIPDDVLHKRSPLTAAERTVMQTHAEIGHQILQGSGIPILERAAEIAHGHHERIDGRGYPQGLAGDAIRLDSRIAAVADVFDALTSTRVYRPAFSVGAALQMMREESGTHFDPVVLQALLDEIATTKPASQGTAGIPLEQTLDSRAVALAAQTVDSESHGLSERVTWRVRLEPIKRLSGNDTVMWRLELDRAGGSVDSVKGQRLAKDYASILHGVEMLGDGEVTRVLVSVHAASLGPILASGILNQGLPSTTATQLVVSISQDGSSIAEIEHDVSVLKRFGCLVAIAEFGFGDSLELAGRCHFDYVNISQRMTDGLATRPAGQLTVRSMASLAEGLGASSICDGIRTDQDADAIRALGVELGAMIGSGDPASFIAAVESVELSALESR